MLSDKKRPSLMAGVAALAASAGIVLQHVGKHTGELMKTSLRGRTGKMPVIRKLRSGGLVYWKRGSRKSCHCHPIKNHQKRLFSHSA